MSDPVALPRPRSREATRQLWIDRLARFAAAGQTVAQFCAAEGVSVPSYYLWKRRLAAPTPTLDPPRLLPVRIAPTAPALELVLPNGLTVRVPAGFDPDALAALLARLGVPPC